MAMPAWMVGFRMTPRIFALGACITLAVSTAGPWMSWVPCGIFGSCADAPSVSWFWTGPESAITFGVLVIAALGFIVPRSSPIRLLGPLALIPAIWLFTMHFWFSGSSKMFAEDVKPLWGGWVMLAGIAMSIAALAWQFIAFVLKPKTRGHANRPPVKPVAQGRN